MTAAFHRGRELGDDRMRYFLLRDSSSHALVGAFALFPGMRPEAPSTLPLWGGRIGRPSPVRMRPRQEVSGMHILLKNVVFGSA